LDVTSRPGERAPVRRGAVTGGFEYEATS
jgi:hypothetical protein